ncbi:MAG: hypothetical protein QNL52_03305 [Synechococcus sp. ChBW.bin.23]
MISWGVRDVSSGVSSHCGKWVGVELYANDLGNPCRNHCETTG